MDYLGDRLNPIYATNSIYDVLNLLRNKLNSARIVYDKNINLYLVGNVCNKMHFDLINEAYKNGYYFQKDFKTTGEVAAYYTDQVEQYNIYQFMYFKECNKKIDKDMVSLYYIIRYEFDFGYLYIKAKLLLEYMDIYSGLPKYQDKVLLKLNN